LIFSSANGHRANPYSGSTLPAMPASHFSRACGRRRGGATGVGLLIGLLLAVTISGGCARSGSGATRPATSAAVSAVGVALFAARNRKVAPNLAGTTLSGAKFSFNPSEAHRIVVVNVWASWCAPCRDESPMLAAMAKRLRGSDVRFIGLDERDTNSRARRFVAATRSDYPHLVDHSGTLLLKLRILPQVAIPSTLVLDRHGRMAARVIGPAHASALQRLVTELADES
jgi:thiol-disulfide isomerase/thioredoxin